MRPNIDAINNDSNSFAPPPGADGQEHEETEAGEEEVSAVGGRSGVWRVDTDEVPLRVGSFVRFDPGTTQVAAADPDGVTFIGIAAPRGSCVARGPF